MRSARFGEEDEEGAGSHRDPFGEKRPLLRTQWVLLAESGLECVFAAAGRAESSTGCAFSAGPGEKIHTASTTRSQISCETRWGEIPMNTEMSLTVSPSPRRSVAVRLDASAYAFRAS